MSRKAIKRTVEQLTAAKELAAAAPGYRVIADAEGWPISPARHGRLEHLGAGQLAAFTGSVRIFNRALAIPGVQRHQTGADEFRVLVERPAIPAVAALLRCHRRRGAPANPFQARPGGASGAVEPRSAAETTPDTGTPP